MSTTIAAKSIQLAWHGKFCPKCLDMDQLEISFTGTARLTYDGSEDCGDHEWDDTSACSCRNCGFSAPAAAFTFGDDGETVLVPLLDEDEETPDTRFEIVDNADSENAYLTVIRYLGNQPEAVAQRKLDDDPDATREDLTRQFGDALSLGQPTQKPRRRLP